MLNSLYITFIFTLKLTMYEVVIMIVVAIVCVVLVCSMCVTLDKTENNHEVSRDDKNKEELSYDSTS